MQTQLSLRRLSLAAILAVCSPLNTHADTQEVLALKAYADFKMGLYDSAFEQFEHLASLNNTQGLLNLAIMLDEGLGCASDPKRATELLERAAAVGHVNAIERLAERYQAGNIISQDQQRAVELYKRAASAGSGKSMYQLFVIYSELNPDEAGYWLEKAKERKYPTALLADQLEYPSEISPEIEIRIREALKSIDRSANNRFVEGVIYYIDPNAVITIETKDGGQQSFTKGQLGSLWKESFERGSTYVFKRRKLTLLPIDRKRIQIESLIFETFDDDLGVYLSMRERLVVSLDDQSLKIQSVSLSIE